MAENNYTVFNAMVDKAPDAVFLGGDLLPHFGSRGNSDFVEDVIQPDTQPNVYDANVDLGAIVAGGTLTVTDGVGNKKVTLARTERKSPTLGAKPPQGAITLFDGATALAWLHDKRCDLVITDVRLPGSDGIQVLETIKEGRTIYDAGVTDEQTDMQQ